MLHYDVLRVLMSPLFGRPDISSELSQPFLASRKLKEYWEVNIWSILITAILSTSRKSTAITDVDEASFFDTT